MNNKCIFIALMAVLFIACTKEAEKQLESHKVFTLRGYQEGSERTKTTVQEGGIQVYWEPNEEIKVFFNGSGSRFVSKNTSLVTAADFEGTINILAGMNEGDNSSNYIWGLYPYRADAISDGVFVTTTLSAEQEGRAGSFAKNTHITLARSKGLDLAFYNVCGGIRFSLTQEGINSISFESLGGEPLAGTISLTFDNGLPAIKEIINPKTVLTLVSKGAEGFQTGQWYYIEALPGTLSNGYKIVFRKDNQIASKVTSTAATILRGHYGSLANVDSDLIFEINGEEPSGNNIAFADEKIKGKLIAAFDTNSDGELSYEEAAAVTSIENVFGTLKNYKSFDEFRYFTNVTNIPSSQFEGWVLNSITLPNSIKTIGDRAFNGCAQLKKIQIPISVTRIGERSFSGCACLTSLEIPNGIQYIGTAYSLEGCSSIKSASIPNNLKIIGYDAFRGCYNLESIVIPQNVTLIRSNAFSGCSKLSTISIPEGVTTIEEEAFDYCSGLLSLSLPNGLSTIGTRAFRGCSSVKSIDIPESVTVLGNGAFEYWESLEAMTIPNSISTITNDLFDMCTALKSIVIAESVSSIGERSFFGCYKLEHLIIPEAVTNIMYMAFRGCTGLVDITFNSETPPTLGYQALSSTGNGPIYVPSSAVERYKTEWPDLSSRITAKQ